MNAQGDMLVIRKIDSKIIFEKTDAQGRTLSITAEEVKRMNPRIHPTGGESSQSKPLFEEATLRGGPSVPTW